MSSRARLILLSGVDGARTATIASATLAALADEGLRGVAIDAGEGAPSTPAAIERVSATLGRVLADVGADPVIPEAWAGLPGTRQLGALLRIVTALTESEADAVVVDCGTFEAARELVDLPAVLLRLLDAALTPRVAMWRSSGDASGEAPTVFEALSTARADVVGMQQALTHPQTSMRLVTVPDDSAVVRTAHALAVFSMLGVAVDGVVMTGFPRSSDGWPRAASDAAAAALERMRTQACGVQVWKSAAKARPVPKGRSAMGPLGSVRVLDADQLVVTVGEEEFDLDLPLVDVATRAAEVGVQGDRLVLRFEGAYRWIDLPPVLRRCRPLHATRTDAGLRVCFTPDPSLWRQPAAPE